MLALSVDGERGGGGERDGREVKTNGVGTQDDKSASRVSFRQS